MMIQETRQAIGWVLCLALLPGSGCNFGGMVDGEAGDGIEVDQSELVGSPETDESYATVFIDLPNGSFCTGTALTDRWIITAAHCVDDMASYASYWMRVCSGTCDATLPDSMRDIIFEGQAEYFPHPHFNPGWTGVDASDDIGLIKLSGAGITGFPRGRIYSDNYEPWHDPNPGSVPVEDRNFTAIGYGRGSDPGGDGCSQGNSSLTLGVKRIREGLYFQVRNAATESIQTSGSNHGICYGDSGGPWLFDRDGKYLAFAVGSYVEDFAWWDDAHACLIKPKWNWIQDTTSAAGMPIECQGYEAGGLSYRMCEDSPIQVRLDAEYGVLTPPMIIGNHGFASQNKYIHVPNGAGTGGKMRYTFYLPREGFFRVWGRVLTPSSRDDSFYVSMDDAASLYWDTPTTPSSTWVWDLVNNYGQADPATFELAQGWHTIEIAQREDGARLDRLIITSSAIFRPWEIWLEAEHGGLTWPMRSALAPSGGFIWVPNGAGSGGAAAYTLGIQPPGKYSIWGLTQASNNGDNSFYLTVDGSDRLLWDTPVTGEWIWDRVSHRGAGDALFWLQGGWHDLFIERREDGSKLDRILITNDLGFVPKFVPIGFVFRTSASEYSQTK